MSPTLTSARPPIRGLSHVLVWGLLALNACGISAKGEAARELSYVERVLGGAQPKEPLPLVIALHGLGVAPEDFIKVFDGFDIKARVVAPRAPDRWAVGSSWFPLDDPEKGAASIRARAGLVAELITRLRTQYPTRGRAIVTGFSQGGVLSFALAAYHPDLLQAALPIAGMLWPGMPSPVAASRALPVIAFHGREDGRIPFVEGERAVKRLKDAGRAAVLHGYEGVGHQISGDLARDLFAALRAQIEAASAAQISASSAAPKASREN